MELIRNFLDSNFIVVITQHSFNKKKKNLKFLGSLIIPAASYEQLTDFLSMCRSEVSETVGLDSSKDFLSIRRTQKPQTKIYFVGFTAFLMLSFPVSFQFCKLRKYCHNYCSRQHHLLTLNKTVLCDCEVWAPKLVKRGVRILGG